MAVYKSNNKGYIILIAVLLLAEATVCFSCHNPSADKKPSTELPAPPPPAADTIPAPTAIRRLPDSTRVYLLGDTKMTPGDGYPAHRDITLDGDAFFVVPAATAALTIHTKLLTIIVKGKAALRVTGPSKEEWGEVDVVNGNVIVRKAYSSPFNAPDTLQGGQMQMINRTIDLMEKEVFDAGVLKAWSDKLPR